MATYVYPAVFQHENAGGYSVIFPDLPGCCTEGDDLGQAIAMARDALGLYLFSLEEDDESIPTASSTNAVHARPDQFVSLVDVDMLAYRQRHDNRSVKKTLTIPAWLNAMAETSNVNFSQALQQALKEKLGLIDQP